MKKKQMENIIQVNENMIIHKLVELVYKSKDNNSVDGWSSLLVLYPLVSNIETTSTKLRSEKDSKRRERYQNSLLKSLQ
jgi:hypothetical protein